MAQRQRTQPSTALAAAARPADPLRRRPSPAVRAPPPPPLRPPRSPPVARQPAAQGIAMEGAGGPDPAAEIAQCRLLVLALAPNAAAPEPGERGHRGGGSRGAEAGGGNRGGGPAERAARE
ncbi:bcl-2-binding component 3, isoforms 3/4-like [Panicum virgatum]|uniref:bcl-2-binding component 3, isoforms 3/4-like n=1 Tax=Panicum virgatum TaxID=38727 RepID=UPI0019D67088|nr:bcl-2-binding component 3, isoforms 3/4-like [Panicum virgatum]